MPALCHMQGGREGRNIDAVELARAVQDLGAGEILLNCIDMDGRCMAGACSFLCHRVVSVAVKPLLILASGACLRHLD